VAQHTQVLTPATVDELVAALAQTTPRSRLLAGGTDLVRTLRQRGGEPDLLIDMSGLADRGAATTSAAAVSTSTGTSDDSAADLTSVRLSEGKLHVGALVTFAELQNNSLVREQALCLGLAAAQVGSAQIRNVGTIGGNVANASPCADGATALTALGAEVTTIDGAGNRRTRPLGAVLLGPGRTSLTHDEAILEYAFPTLESEHRTAFVKVGSRLAVTVARVSVALVVRFDAAAGALSDVRVALGAVGNTAFRAEALERELEGCAAGEETARRFAAGCVAAVEASIPGRYSLPYKRHAVLGVAYDAWNMLALGPPLEPS